MVVVDSGGQPTHYVDVRLRRELYTQSSLDHEEELKSPRDFIEWGSKGVRTQTMKGQEDQAEVLRRLQPLLYTNSVTAASV
jgi:hypothetical protein